MKKIAFYMSGNYARVLRHCTEHLQEYELYAFCPNNEAYVVCREDGRFSGVEYLYKNLNDLYRSAEGSELGERFPELNISRALFVDKSHYKRYSGEYQVKVINAMGLAFSEWFERIKPDYIIFPIIESVDAMLAYSLSSEFDCQPMVYTHTRHLHTSFFSHSHCEILPPYTDQIELQPEVKDRAGKMLDDFKNDRRALAYDYKLSSTEDVYADCKTNSVFLRFIKNIKLKMGPEKHNQTLRFSTKFQVFLQRIFVPYHNFKYRIVEKMVVRPKDNITGEFDFFPLHFSPESSINTPAPFYIDQERVVDKILLTRKGNRILVLKEHPAVRGYRPISFYRKMKKKPYVVFSSVSSSTNDLLDKSSSTFSVTGTVCMEAFFNNKDWVQYGENFLSAWFTHNKKLNNDTSPQSFIEDVLKVSSDFILFSPKVSAKSNSILMSKKNISTMCDSIRFFIKNI